jgi:hypothetical protein
VIDLVERLELSETLSKMESMLAARICAPEMEMLDPSLTKDLSEKLDPKKTESMTDMFEPNLELPLREMVDPSVT